MVAKQSERPHSSGYSTSGVRHRNKLGRKPKNYRLSTSLNCKSEYLAELQCCILWTKVLLTWPQRADFSPTPLLIYLSLSNHPFFEHSVHPNHSGSLPETIGEGWSKMTNFQIQGNVFTGSLPPSLGNWTNLNWLNVQSNHLTGSLSETFGAWSKLEYCLLNANSFTGALPSAIVNWNLFQFTISNNIFSGSLPENIGNWGKLQYFQVRGVLMTP